MLGLYILHSPNGRILHKADITVDATVQKVINCTVRSVNQQLRYNAIKS